MREKKKSGHSRVSEKQDNTTSDAREKKLGRSRVVVRVKKKIKAQQGKLKTQHGTPYSVCGSLVVKRDKLTAG